MIMSLNLNGSDGVNSEIVSTVGDLQLIAAMWDDSGESDRSGLLRAHRTEPYRSHPVGHGHDPGGNRFVDPGNDVFSFFTL